MKISIIIIGYNTLNTLKLLLQSINDLNYNDSCEVIYVDDGSTDGSYSCFEDFNLKYNKKGFSFQKNSGRVFARQKAIELSCGDWLFFTQSNVILDPFILSKYQKGMVVPGVVAVGGGVFYQSEDEAFIKYLNHKTRGVHKYGSCSKMHYKHLLFLNCIIKKSVFDKVNFNPVFNSYGGKELDFAFRLNGVFPNAIIACRDALITRINYPDYLTHCLRFYEYGSKNFTLLNVELKKNVVHYPFLLHGGIVLSFLVNVFYYLSSITYKINSRIIRLGLLCSLLRGYYKTK